MRITVALSLVVAVACQAPPTDAALDALAADVTQRWDLTCLPVHFVAVRARLDLRRHQVCGPGPSFVPSDRDTLTIVSRDSLGHALSVTRMWLATDVVSSFAALRASLERHHGAGTECAGDPGSVAWADGLRRVSIDTLSDERALVWRVELRLGEEPCAATT